MENLLEDARAIPPIPSAELHPSPKFTQDKRSSASHIGNIIKRDLAMMAKIAPPALPHYSCVPFKTPSSTCHPYRIDVIQAIMVASQLIEQADAFGANTSSLKHLPARALVIGTQAQELGIALN